MEGRLAKFIMFAVVSLLAMVLAVLFLVQAFTFKANMFLGVPIEIPVITIGMAILWLGDN